MANSRHLGLTESEAREALRIKEKVEREVHINEIDESQERRVRVVNSPPLTQLILDETARLLQTDGWNEVWWEDDVIVLKK